MTISRTARLACYTSICALLMLAAGTSNAGRKIVPLAIDDDISKLPNGENIPSGDSATLHIDVLANDERLDDGVADLILTTPASLVGTAVKAGADSEVGRLHVHYTYPAGFGGTETFTYRIESNRGEISNSATIAVTVDGSIAQTSAGSNKIVFGGAAFPGSNVPLSATGETAIVNGIGTSSVKCCTVRDPRVSAGGSRKNRVITYAWSPLDLGTALRDETLSDESLNVESCADIAPPAGTLIIPPHFGVHAQNLLSTDPEAYRFGVCVVDTDATWQGPVQVDVVAERVIDYPVDCKTTLGVHKQPLVLGLSTAPTEFTSPEMRAVTIECDPRSVTRWSKWFFVVNAVHLADKDESRGYVARMFTALRSMIEEMRKKSAVDGTFLNDLTSLVLAAQNPSNSATGSMASLDAATLMALTPPDGDPYQPNTSFSNPKGELVSHLAALRYAICSELAYPGNLAECRVNEAVDNALPELPQSP